MRILLVDDHAIVRQGYEHLIRQCIPSVEVAQAATPREAFAAVRQQLPDVIVLDLNLPAGGGLRLLRRLRHSFPGCRVLVCSAHEDAVTERAARRLGAIGYLGKTAGAAELPAALRAVAAGRAYPESAREPLAPAVGILSARQREVLRALASGMSTEQAAQSLGISGKTLANHRAALCERLGLRGVRELATLTPQWRELQ